MRADNYNAKYYLAIIIIKKIVLLAENKKARKKHQWNDFRTTLLKILWNIEPFFGAPAATPIIWCNLNPIFGTMFQLEL